MADVLHDLDGTRCTCGEWEAPLGESIHRGFDEHLLSLRCNTEGCTGDTRYAAPGRGHVEGCTHPFDAGTPPLEFREHEPIPGSEHLPQFMTIVLLFGAARQGCTRDEKRALYEAHRMLQEKKPLAEVAQAILDARGPEWKVPDETMQAIERLHTKEDT